MILLYAIAAGLLAGRLTGGRIDALGMTRIAWLPVALGGLVLQGVLFSSPVATRIGDAGPALYVASTLAVFAALLRNLRLPGFPLLAVGALCNLAAILANGGAMPSSPEAWLALDGVARVPAGEYTNSVLAGPDTLLPWLGDIFVLPRPIPLANVFSIGDVLIGLGAAWYLVVTMRRPAPAATPARPNRSASAA